MDKIIITNLKVATIIGTLPEERSKTQELSINLELYLSLEPAGKRDNLLYSVDYSQIEAKIIELGKKSKFFLIEAFAEAVANICLKEDLVLRVKIEVIKSGALKHSDSVAVCIEREKRNEILS
jgi:FolB domain-containing protein